MTDRAARRALVAERAAHDAREQAFRLRTLLLARLEDGLCEPPAHGVATCFPDVAFSAPPSQDDLSRTALGEQHLRWLDQALPSLVEHALPGSPQEADRSARPVARSGRYAVTRAWGLLA